MHTTFFAKLSRQIPKVITKLTTLSFLALLIFGIFDCTNFIMQNQMDMNENTQHTIPDCISSKTCGMDINEHLSVWQDMFIVNLGADFFSFFAVLLLVGIIFRISKLASISFTPSFISSYLYYERDHGESKLYNYLVNVFATGILQPKLFA